MEQQHSFQNRKVKFFIFNRKEIQKNKMKIADLSSYDELDIFDVEKQMWNDLSNYSDTSFGRKSRSQPNVPLMWRARSFAINGPDVAPKMFKLEDVIENTRKLTRESIGFNSSDVDYLHEYEAANMLTIRKEKFLIKK